MILSKAEARRVVPDIHFLQSAGEWPQDKRPVWVDRVSDYLSRYRENTIAPKASNGLVVLALVEAYEHLDNDKKRLVEALAECATALPCNQPETAPEQCMCSCCLLTGRMYALLEDVTTE